MKRTDAPPPVLRSRRPELIAEGFMPGLHEFELEATAVTGLQGHGTVTTLGRIGVIAKASS